MRWPKRKPTRPDLPLQDIPCAFPGALTFHKTGPQRWRDGTPMRCRVERSVMPYSHLRALALYAVNSCPKSAASARSSGSIWNRFM